MATQPASSAPGESLSVVNSKARVRTNLSPPLVFPASDWRERKDHEDFLGFAIRRTPAFKGKGRAPACLFNKVTFDPPAQDAKPVESDEAPLQKFHWWEGGIRNTDPDAVFTYDAIPVRGTGKSDLRLQMQCTASVTATIQQVVEHGIGTYFNRAVLSSQLFHITIPRHQHGRA
jgi:hypothetical protein